MLLLLSLFAAAASAAPAAAQSRPCQKHPTWKIRDCERVAKKEMWVGMTGEMLLESRGAPVRTRKLTTAAGVNQDWFYEKRSGSAFRDGECVSGCKTEIIIVHIGPTLRVDSIEEN
jgi:hypothetical protein